MTAHIPASPFGLANPAYSQTDGHAHLNLLANDVRELLGGEDEEQLVISGAGAITPTGASIKMLPASGGVADILDSISVANHPSGRYLMIRPATAGHVLTVRHLQGGSGQIALKKGTTLDLVSPEMSLFLKLRGTIWFEVARFYDGDPAGLAANRAYLGVPDASEDDKGIIQAAGPAQSWQDDGMLALTVEGLAAASGSNLNGNYLRLPGKHCLQFGMKIPSNTIDVIVTLPLVYADADYSILLTAAGAGAARIANFNTQTAGSFKLACWTVGELRSTAEVKWWTIGKLA